MNEKNLVLDPVQTTATSVTGEQLYFVGTAVVPIRLGNDEIKHRVRIASGIHHDCILAALTR